MDRRVVNLEGLAVGRIEDCNVVPVHPDDARRPQLPVVPAEVSDLLTGMQLRARLDEASWVGQQLLDVVSDFCAGRGGKYPHAFLKDWSDTLVVDAYGGYDATLSIEGRSTAHCLAHARRKFDELVKANVRISEERDRSFRHRDRRIRVRDRAFR